MSDVKKPTPEERKERTNELREKHQPVFDALGVPDAVFIPKMAHYQKGLEGLHMGFFESELEHGEDVYTEMVSMQMTPEDPGRTLYRYRANPHYKEELAASEPMPNGHCRYFVPVDELEEVTMPTKSAPKKRTASKATSKVDDIVMIPQDPDMGDIPMDQMTMRDYAAIQLKVPMSSKSWLNDMIEEAAKPF